MMNTPHADPDDHPYDEDGLDDGAGARTPLSTTAKVWVGLGLAGLIAGAAWIGWGQATQPVRWQDVGFDVVSNSEASVTFDVFLYTDQPVVCELRALNSNYGEVGVATTAVDPADGSEQRFTITMATVEEATTAVVRYCGVE